MSGLVENQLYRIENSLAGWRSDGLLICLLAGRLAVEPTGLLAGNRIIRVRNWLNIRQMKILTDGQTGKMTVMVKWVCTKQLNFSALMTTPNRNSQHSSEPYFLNKWTRPHVEKSSMITISPFTPLIHCSPSKKIRRKHLVIRSTRKKKHQEECWE